MANKLALITGASTGIGFELAKLAAQDGYDLVVVADEALIEESAEELRSGGTAVVAVEADLATFEGVDKLLSAAENRPIDVLCANAGVGTGGAFLDQNVDKWHHSIDTNVTGTVYLLQKVMAQMVARGDGKILVTGSIAGHVPGSFNAVYNATKAFVDNFTDALRDELKDHRGVTLTTLKPGATDTLFFHRAGMDDTKVGQDDSKADPGKVAMDGWTAMLEGKGNITSGLMNKLQVAASGVAPVSVMAHQHRKMAEPASADS